MKCLACETNTNTAHDKKTRAERYYRFSDISQYFVINYRDTMPVHYCH